jgi:hypothetical protein
MAGKWKLGTIGIRLYRDAMLVTFFLGCFWGADVFDVSQNGMCKT